MLNRDQRTPIESLDTILTIENTQRVQISAETDHTIQLLVGLMISSVDTIPCNFGIIFAIRLSDVHCGQKKDQHCFVHNFYKFKHIVLIFGKQHHGGIANILL